MDFSWLISRDEFEILSTKKKRAYIQRAYPRVCATLFSGAKYGEVHHCWEKAHCPLWYQIDPRNLMLLASHVHSVYHNVSKDNWSESEIIQIEKALAIKQQMIDDNRDYWARQGIHA